jgi:hypothetical protein
MRFNFFKKRETGEGLDRAYNLGLITEREFLELKIQRAQRELEKITEVKIKVKKK